MRRFTVCEMLSHFNNDPPHKIPLLSHSGMVLVQNITNRFSESWKSLILQRIIFGHSLKTRLCRFHAERFRTRSELRRHQRLRDLVARIPARKQPLGNRE